MTNNSRRVTKVDPESNIELLRNSVTVNDETTDVYVSLVGVQGSRGPTGPTGPLGPTGPQGESGAGILTGEGPPSSGLGVIGDVYFDLIDKEFWGPKTITGWPPAPFLSPFTNRYVHSQPTASSTWNITHPLGGYPSVTVVDSASTVVVGDVLYLSTTQVQVNFAAAFSGFAYLT